MNRLLILVVLFAFLAACAAARPDREVLQDVRFDPATVAGKEGFFRVGKSTEGRWWFIDPDGNAFYYRGVTSINRAGTPGGRRAVPGPYAKTVDAKYGSDPAVFRDAALARLRQWNFNALGAWCGEEFFDAPTPLALPYTEITEFGYCGPQIKGNGVWVPDVFDPAWEKAIDEKARVICTPRRKSRMLVGYFTDNELGWAQHQQEDIEAQADPEAARKIRTRPLLLQQCLSLPETSAAYQAAWAFVLERHGGSLEQVSRDWGVPMAAREDMRKLTAIAARIVPGEPQEPASQPATRRGPRGGRGRGAASQPAWKAILTPGYIKDQQDFSRLFAERYFRLSAEAIRRYDPNHLILGCRFGGPPGDTVLHAMKREWVDVVSANNYRPNFYERMDIYYRGTGLPVLNGEYAWTGGLFHMNSKNRLGMVDMGQKGLKGLFAHPAVVGYTWYRWDQRRHDFRDPRALSVGLVDLEDEPITINTDALTYSNALAASVARRARMSRATDH